MIYLAWDKYIVNEITSTYIYIITSWENEKIKPWKTSQHISPVDHDSQDK